MNAEYPGAIVVEARNYGYKGIYHDYENRPKGFVLHTPEEQADDHMFTPYYFATTDRPASTHYFVSFHGFVIQCVPENEGAYANAVEGKPKPAWHTRENLNLETLSVEIEGYAATIASTISAAQKTALLSLLRHRCQAHGIPIDRQHIIGHYEVANNRTDPGTLDIDAIVAELQQGAGEMTPEQAKALATLMEQMALIVIPALDAQKDVNAVLAIVQGQVDGLIKQHPPGAHAATQHSHEGTVKVE